MSTVGVNPPKTPVTEGSGDKSPATLPNVCKMPGPPAPFVPTPLPNIGQSSDGIADGTTTVKFEGKKVAIKGSSYTSKLSPDMASKGTGGGIISAKTEGKTEFVAPGSMNVKAEGKNIQLLGDAMTNNGGSPVNASTLPGNIQGAATPGFVDQVGQEAADTLCDAACRAIQDHANGETRTKQDAMAKYFSEKKPPLYRPTDSKILPEVSQLIPSSKGGMMKTLLSGTGAVTPSGATAPMSMLKAMRTCAKGTMTRWDFVIPKNKNVRAIASNIKQYIEVKFPDDELTDNQKTARKRMRKVDRDKIVEMKPEEDCVCS